VNPETEIPDAVRFTAKRFPLSIEVTVDANYVRWVYRCWGNEWREQLPLGILVPYPTICVNGNARRLTIGTGIAVALLGTLLLTVFWDPIWLIILECLLLASGVATAIVSFRRQPLEWANFDSFMPGKTIYFFCGKERSDFQQFVEKLKGSILAAGPVCRPDARCDT